MDERDRHHTLGMEETAAAWEPPKVLQPRPLLGPVDWDELIAEIERDFPKTLARLAE